MHVSILGVFYGGQDFEVALQFELDDQPFRTLFPGDRLKVCPRFTSASAFGTDFKSVPAFLLLMLVFNSQLVDLVDRQPRRYRNLIVTQHAK